MDCLSSSNMTAFMGPFTFFPPTAQLTACGILVPQPGRGCLPEPQPWAPHLHPEYLIHGQLNGRVLPGHELVHTGAHVQVWRVPVRGGAVLAAQVEKDGHTAERAVRALPRPCSLATRRSRAQSTASGHRPALGPRHSSWRRVSPEAPKGSQFTPISKGPVGKGGVGGWPQTGQSMWGNLRRSFLNICR